MNAGKNYFIVKIDKEAQRQKRERLPSGLFIAPEYIGMMYNLQYGEILSIGFRAQRIHPLAEVGDVLLFKHTVEDDDSCLIREEKKMFVTKEGNTEFRIASENKVVEAEHEVYGFIKPDGTLVPGEQWVFLSPMITTFKKKYKSDRLIHVDDEMWSDPERIKDRIEELKFQIQSLKESYSSMSTDTGKGVDALDDLNKQIESHMYEQSALTYELHKDRLAIGTVLHINEATSAELCDTYPGDQVIVLQNTLYPLHILDQRFLLAEKSTVYANATIGITDNNLLSK